MTRRTDAILLYACWALLGIGVAVLAVYAVYG